MKVKNNFDTGKKLFERGHELTDAEAKELGPSLIEELILSDCIERLEQPEPVKEEIKEEKKAKPKKVG